MKKSYILKCTIVLLVLMKEITAAVSTAVVATEEKEKEEEEEKVKLNLYIFKQLSYYLATLDNSKERLLELSLLSKSCFKIFQNIITSYDFNRNKFILSLSQLIDYIISATPTSNDENNNDKSYQFKLIQYKDIERIKVHEISKECLTLLDIGNKNVDVNKEIHSFLKSNCIKLKKVVILDQVHCFPKIKYDYTCSSFFKVKKLSMIWSRSNLPISIDENVNVSANQYTYYPFTFNFLLKYNPSKLLIGTGKTDVFYDDGNGSYANQNRYLYKLDNILQCKSIKSIKFSNHVISVDFLKLILNANPETHATIKSLTICGLQDNRKSITDDIINRLKTSNFTSNTTLKKLVIESNEDPNIHYDGPDDDRVDILLNSIKQNKSLNTLGLNGFNIYNEKELEILNEIKSITKLIITGSDLEATLKHVKTNTNLKKLQIIDKYSRETKYLKLISDFFNDIDNNNSLLKPSSIIITNKQGISKSYSSKINEKNNMQ